MGAKLHKFKDGCARLKPMKSLKVKIKDFWGCIVANAEKWIFDPLVWEWALGQIYLCTPPTLEGVCGGMCKVFHGLPKTSGGTFTISNTYECGLNYG